ncbi:hypothetical protein MHU86_12381 [Fragilaria crotonensis]|nr:hypothetical protein MHU86_12381 [Fragilaria crotonensis]
MAAPVEILRRVSVAVSQNGYQGEERFSSLLERKPRHSQLPDLSLQDLTSFIYSNRKSIQHYAWYTIIAVVALLDFLAKVVADFIREEEVETPLGFNPFVFHRRQKSRTTGSHRIKVVRHPLLVHFIHFLEKHSVFISMIFSLLWFIDAFVKATDKRDAQLAELDKRNLLDNRRTTPNGDISDEIRGAWGVFHHTVVVQCLLLPISFFMLMHHLLSPKHSPSGILLDEDERVQFKFREESGQENTLHSFDSRLSHSVLFVILQFVGTVYVRITGIHIRARYEEQKRLLAKRLAIFAIRSPKRFIRRVRMVLSAIYWFKYLKPLIATGNKLRGNVVDLMRKHRQRRQASQAERIRRLLWVNRLRNLPPEELEREAAIMVQRNFRRQQAAKAVRALQLFQGSRTQWAALIIQHMFRQKLASARARIINKRYELRELQKKRRSFKRQWGTMSVKERRRLYELQDELRNEATQLLNSKMLIRPNTRFAVTWKILFVVCVVFEISQHAVAPTLKKYVDEESGEPMRIGKVLEQFLIPLETSQWQRCGAKNAPKPRKAVKIGCPLVRWLTSVGRRAQGAKSEGSNVNKLPFPWFCQKPYSTAHSIFIKIMKMLIYQFLVLVGTVCFLDVFVTFFTGEIDADSGNLRPKPFFSRWVFPGIALQLLVNPQMESISRYVWKFVTFAHRVGPIQMYRWTAALFYPLVSLVLHLLIFDIWRPIVALSNNTTNRFPDNNGMTFHRCSMKLRKKSLIPNQ